MVGIQARHTNCTCLTSRVINHSPTHLAHGGLWIIISPHKMQIFESDNKNTISTAALNYMGTTGTLTYQFFLKSIDLKVPNLIKRIFYLSVMMQTPRYSRRVSVIVRFRGLELNHYNICTFLFVLTCFSSHLYCHSFTILTSIGQWKSKETR